MIYKVDLNSNVYFSTTNPNTSDNRTYALDVSFLKNDKKYLMTHNFLSKHINLAPYPPAALTGNTTTISGQSYGNGDYITTASTEGGTNYRWKAFDKTQANYWRSIGSVYTIGGNPPYSYYGSTYTPINGGPNIYGEWNQIQLPNSIVLSGFYFDFNRSSSVEFRDFVITGSNDGIAFNIIYQGYINLPADKGVYFEVPIKKTAFSRYRFIATSGAGGQGYIELSEWILYEDRDKLSTGLISINMGSFAQNYQGSSNTSKKNTHLAGLLRVKGKNLYSKSHHQAGMFFIGPPNNNFLTINLLQMDGITPLNLAEPYYLQLFFEELD